MAVFVFKENPERRRPHSVSIHHALERFSEIVSRHSLQFQTLPLCFSIEFYSINKYVLVEYASSPNHVDP